MAVFRFDPTLDAIKSVSNLSFPGLREAQWWLVNVSRWVRATHGLVGGYWDGEIGPSDQRGIMALGPDAAQILTETRSGDEPRLHDNFKLADDVAVANGFVGGYWNGERVVTDGGYRFNVVCIKSEHGERIRLLESTLLALDQRYFEGMPFGSQTYGLYPDGAFRATRRAGVLPGLNTPARFLGVIPLFKYEATNQGMAHVCIGLR